LIDCGVTTPRRGRAADGPQPEARPEEARSVARGTRGEAHDPPEVVDAAGRRVQPIDAEERDELREAVALPVRVVQERHAREVVGDPRAPDELAEIVERARDGLDGRDAIERRDDLREPRGEVRRGARVVDEAGDVAGGQSPKVPVTTPLLPMPRALAQEDGASVRKV
jgi:hypothetical protein